MDRVSQLAYPLVAIVFLAVVVALLLLLLRRPRP